VRAELVAIGIKYALEKAKDLMVRERDQKDRSRASPKGTDAKGEGFRSFS
jgi:hypothetical protein